MNKRELAAQVATQTGLTAVVASKAIDAVFKSIRENLEKGEPTTIKGFGYFTISSRAKRRGINPSTREAITIPACKVVKLSPSKMINIK
ncbi:MAG: HU family DNA-binding protein [Bacteroidales bacterium]